MKRFKHMVIGGIQSKVFNLILVTVLLMSAAFLIISQYQENILINLAEETSERQQAAIEDTTNGIMGTVV